MTETTANVPLNRNVIGRYKETRKFPWSAVTAGVIVALSIQLIFNLLGAGIGTSGFDINSSDVILRSIVFITWILLSGIVAMFLGGWVAGSLSYHHADKIRQATLGLTMWGAATLITFFFTFGTAGALLSNTLNITKQGFALLGQSTVSLARTAPQAVETAKNLFPDLTKIQDQIVQESEKIFSDVKMKIEDDPNALKELKKELKETVISLITAEKGDAKNAVKEKTLTFLTGKLEIDRTHAEELIAAWLDKYTQLKEQTADAAQKAKEKAADTTEKIVNTLGTASLITAFAFIVSACAAMLGAIVAGRRFTR